MFNYKCIYFLLDMLSILSWLCIAFLWLSCVLFYVLCRHLLQPLRGEPTSTVRCQRTFTRPNYSIHLRAVQHLPLHPPHCPILCKSALHFRLTPLLPLPASRSGATPCHASTAPSCPSVKVSLRFAMDSGVVQLPV